MGQRPDRRLDTFYRAGVIGAPYVDKLIRALRLLVMIGQIRAEIGPASVRFLDRTVLIVAKLGGAKQRQLDWLPILRSLSLRGFKHSVIDKTTGAQFSLRGFRITGRL